MTTYIYIYATSKLMIQLTIRYLVAFVISMIKFRRIILVEFKLIKNFTINFHSCGIQHRRKWQHMQLPNATIYHGVLHHIFISLIKFWRMILVEFIIIEKKINDLHFILQGALEHCPDLKTQCIVMDEILWSEYCLFSFPSESCKGVIFINTAVNVCYIVFPSQE